MEKDLEDIQQTVIYIPYDEDDAEAPEESALPSVRLENDLADGPQLRFAAYKVAWTHCLDRMKFIISELYSPVVSDVADRLENIHTDVLPGIAFPELPVVTIADLSGGSFFLDHLNDRFDEEATLVNHLYPSDSLNITVAMRNLIGGFIDRDTDAPKRKPAASLAPFDIGLLQAWYDATEDPRPTLVVLLHHFEQFDANVVQDMFYICSLHTSRLPLTFILSLSTPSPSSYLQASLSRSTLSLIRVYHFAVPSGRDVLQDILLLAFFDPTFDLSLLPGPTLLEFVEDFYTTQNPSLDALITILQVAHLKHFSTNVFSFLSIDNPRISPHPTPTELSFLEALLARMSAPRTSATPKKNADDWRANARSPEILLQSVDAERAAFVWFTRKISLGVTLLHIVVDSLRGTAIDKSLDRWRGAAGIRRVLDPEKEGVVGLAELLRKLPPAVCDAIPEKVESYIEALPVEFREIAEWRHGSSADDVAGWLETYLALLLRPPENHSPLWNVWYTGLAPFPSEMLNPALRPSIISGLSYPHSYTGEDADSKPADEDEDEDEESLEDLPDTSILFKGYVKAGKMINVYDWFDHFRMVLEGQRARETATKGKGKGKAKVKAKKGEDEREEDERWKLSVQARFMRALHELDYVGFIKHTSRGGGGRKGEYVLRTVLGVLE
ncbi:origin recognition complex subunit 3 N-terminus-domain-containing protein [Mycena vitilis]|nr:origin recognition complex subunit 3 N-terminus-domain-containing protein [Mycena vitilis]